SIHQWPLNLKKTWFTTAPANFTSPGGRGEDQQQKKAPASTPGPSFAANAMSACLLVLVAVLERGAQDVAQRRARIGRAVLRDGLLLFGDFQRLDRDLHLARLLVELDHPRIDLLAHRKAVGTLVVAVARELRALDEGGKVGAGDLHLDTALLHLE